MTNSKKDCIFTDLQHSAKRSKDLLIPIHDDKKLTLDIKTVTGF